MWMLILLAVGAMLTVASPWIPGLEQWGPLLLLWTAGGALLAWIVQTYRAATLSSPSLATMSSAEVSGRTILSMAAIRPFRST